MVIGYDMFPLHDRALYATHKYCIYKLHNQLAKIDEAFESDRAQQGSLVELAN